MTLRDRVTQRVRPTVSRRRRTGWENEERTQFWVTLGFIVLIGLALLMLGAAVAVGYYNDHLKPIATVNGVGITRDDVASRTKVELFRYDRALALLRSEVSAGRITQEQASSQTSQLQQQEQQADTQALDELIDQRLMHQLAAEMNISVTPADIDAAFTNDATTPEARHVLAVVVKPHLEAVTGTTPTDASRKAAHDQAVAALAAIRGGKTIAQAAQQYSTDTTKDNGGDYGIVHKPDPADITVTDKDWLDALFAVPLNGITDVVEGDDGSYRIGQVVSIIPATLDPTLQGTVDRQVGMGAYRDALDAKIVANKLQTSIVTSAIAGDQEQVNASEIAINVPANTSDDAEGAIHSLHILFSPKHDAAGAKDLPPDDPSWEAAHKLADAAANQIKAVTDAAAREAKLAELAKTESDDTASGSRGGDLGFSYRSTLVPQYADPLWNAKHVRGDVIGPVKSEFGWHVIMFLERRPGSKDAAKQVVDKLRAGADVAALAKQWSDAIDAASGGSIGWIARYQVSKEVEDAVFGLQAGQVSEPVTQTQTDQNGAATSRLVVYKVTERAKRPLDPTQRAAVRQSAFRNWYDVKKKAANIVREDDTGAGGVTQAPSDVPSDVPVGSP